MTKYLFRIDDICPTMHWDNFSRLKDIFERYEIKPLLAIVPQNHDPVLVCLNNNGVQEKDFWELMRRLQQDGWEIGQHGFEHRYVTSQGGLLKVKKESEFAGLSIKEQQEKVRRGKEILSHYGIETDIFVAPGHSLDINTCKALLMNGFHYISDGFSLYPYKNYGLVWIPQMLWRLWRMPVGIHTFCLHLNNLSSDDFLKIERFIQRNRGQITTFKEVKRKFKNPSRFLNLLSFIIYLCWHLLFKIRNTLLFATKTL